jgi:hypothetical protein
MIKISISRELAADHPDFLAGRAERGHRVEVFGNRPESPESHAAEACNPDDLADAAHIGQPHPLKGYYATSTVSFRSDPDGFCGCPICEAAARSALEA